MKTYCVNLKETSYGFVEVQADNEEEAKEIAYKAWLERQRQHGRKCRL
nr:MAG TPA: PcfM DpnD/PcfM-like protein [Caudoviricetes sp.]